METREEITAKLNLLNKKFDNGEYLTLSEENLRAEIIIAFFPNQYKLSKDVIYNYSYNHLNTPNDKKEMIELMLNRANIKSLDVLSERLIEFENYFDTNHHDHFIKELSGDCSKEINEVRKVYTGLDLLEQEK